ncbi:hypothetical protein [Sabulicella rubraurantiaca]|uniref:hypothetical protein n=1 Tax=Sabulicella rubraurantiaca TaxID=2811429 RepID=UPI001A9630EB|nr:hypothetical protein [Sabulicella rubraurantiaca]
MFPAASRAEGLERPGPLSLDALPNLHLTFSDRPAQALPFGLPAPVPPPRPEPVAPILLDKEAQLTELDEPFLEEDPAEDKEGASGKTEENPRKRAAGSTRPRPNSIEGALAGVGGPEYIRVLSSHLPDGGVNQAAFLRAGQGMSAVSLLAPMMATAEDMALLAPQQDWPGGLGVSWSVDAMNGAARRASPGSGGPGPDAMEFHVNFALPTQATIESFSVYVALQFERGTPGPQAPVLPHIEAPGAAPKAQPRPAPEPEATGWRPHVEAEAFEQPRGSAVEPVGGLPDTSPKPEPSPEPASSGQPRDVAQPAIALPAPAAPASPPGLGDAGPTRPTGAPLPLLEQTVQAITYPGNALGLGYGKGADPSPLLPAIAIGLPDVVAALHRGPGHRAEAAANPAEGQPGRAHENQPAKVVAEPSPVTALLPVLEVGLFVPPGHAKRDEPEASKDSAPPGIETKLPLGLAADGPGNAHDKQPEKELPLPAAVVTPLLVDDLPGKGHDKQTDKTLPITATIDDLLPEATGSGNQGKASGQPSEKAPAHIPATLEVTQPGKSHGKPSESSAPNEAAPSGKPHDEGADFPAVPLHPVHLELETAGSGKGQAAKESNPPASTSMPAAEGPDKAHGKQAAEEAEPVLTLVLPEIPGGAPTHIDLGSKGKAEKATGLDGLLAGGGSKSHAAEHGPNSVEPTFDLLANEPHPAGKPGHGPPFATSETGFDTSHPSHHSASDWHL